MDEKVPWAYELYESGIMAKSRKEALKIIKKRLEEHSKLSLSDLEDLISMWDQV